MVILMDDIDKAFSNAIAKFDFDAVRVLMVHKDWTWVHCGVPDKDQMIEKVIKLYSHARKYSHGSCSSGGFGVYIDKDELAVTVEFSMGETVYYE